MARLKNLLWWLIAGSRGGASRGRIINSLHEQPKNANQLATVLGMDYKTIRHHLKVLEENDMLNIVNRDDYGAMYFLSSLLESNYSDFEEIWSQVEGRVKVSKVEGESDGGH